MKKLTYALCTALAVLLCWNCCQSPDCHNVTGPSFTEEGLEWFPYAEEDTIFFENAGDGQEYFLICTSYELTKDTSWYDNIKCERGGFFQISKILKIDFLSDFPCIGNNPFQIKMVNTSGYSTIVVSIEQYTTPDNNYKFNITLDLEEELFKPTFMNGSIAIEKGTIIINEKAYQNVSAICNQIPLLSDYDIYDTIYYNREGFLKFISSQYGHVLERVE